MILRLFKNIPTQLWYWRVAGAGPYGISERVSVSWILIVPMWIMRISRGICWTGKC
jgi:hypothetical protein